MSSDPEAELLDMLHRISARGSRISIRMMSSMVDESKNLLDGIDGELAPEVGELWDEIMENVERERLPYGIRRGLDSLNTEIRARTPLTIPEVDIDENTEVVFLLGAGASKASNIPTVDELLEVLIRQARRTRREDLQPLIEYCDDDDTNVNIEDLLTAAYLSDFAVSDRHVSELVHYFLFGEDDSLSGDGTPPTDPTSVTFIQNTLQTLFSSITSTMIKREPNETHQAVREFTVSHSNNDARGRATIVTTNYDYCMDQELTMNDIQLAGTIDGADPGEDGAVDLLKMHGSINWWYCNSCQKVSSVSPYKVKESLGEESMDYAVLGICPNCHGERRPLLVPPTSFKFLQFPHLIEIWNTATERIQEADYIIVVGYSFSDSDAYIHNLVSRSMTESAESAESEESERTVLINVNPEREVTNKLEKRFSAQLSDFDPEKRILGIPEKSEEAVPMLVNEMLNYQEVDGGPRRSEEARQTGVED